ncbi:MAG: SMC family ATPase [Chloroflexi bacterium]|nr:SMC family ATPase [Chloroflexota bacterium]
MIPIRLGLRNFMCYGENLPPLVFEGIHLACLSGDNGHGKSAILDAMTWALWGKARAKADDDLIHLGRSEMEVDFEFSLSDVHYRVVRKRLKARTERASGQTVLELHVAGDGDFRSITGNSVRDTERKIVDLLRMEYDTFINSAFVLQGRADEFTVKPPTERKRVLSEILGLAYFDRLEERAKEQAKARDSLRRELTAAIGEMEKELGKKVTYEVELREVQLALDSLDARVKRQEAELGTLRERKRGLDFKAEQAKEVGQQLAYAGREIAELDKEMADRRARVAGFEQVRADRAEVEAGFSRLATARQENEALHAKLRQQHQLAERFNLHVMRVDQARNELVTQQRLLQREIQNMEPKWQMLAAWEQELVEANRHLCGLAELDAEREGKRTRAHEMASHIEVLRSDNQRLRADMAGLKEKVDLLAQSEAVCPLCETDLGDDGKRRIQQKFASEGREKAETHRSNDREIKALGQSLDALQKEVADLEATINRDRNAAQRKVGTLEKNIADAKTAAEEIARHRVRLDELTGKLDNGQFAEEDQVQVARLDADLRALAYDTGRHDEVRRLCDDLARYDELHRRLEEADRLIAQEQSAVARGEAALERWRAEVAENTLRRTALEKEVAELPQLASRIADAQHVFEALVVTWSQEGQRLGAVQQKIRHCEYLEGQKREKAVALGKAVKEKAIFDDLSVALGKKGIQAMIIEAAIPDIQDKANAILGRMTDSRMAIAFETQRDNKKGETVETLDIKIADELGTRSYEMFSGGEAFRINFAVRIALSKMLAHRAGARLQTLVIDEGFGTQDASGREKLVEAINAIQDDFEKVLVITHIQELKDLFPVRIEVVKTGEGSTFSIN